MSIDPGDYTKIYVNQGTRQAYVLAVIGDEALIEYQMPKGSTSLRVVSREDPDQRVYKNVSYFRLPNKWGFAMAEAGTHWIGQPQQHNQVKGPVPDPYISNKFGIWIRSFENGQ